MFSCLNNRSGFVQYKPQITDQNTFMQTLINLQKQTNIARQQVAIKGFLQNVQNVQNVKPDMQSQETYHEISISSKSKKISKNAIVQLQNKRCASRKLQSKEIQKKESERRPLRNFPRYITTYIKRCLENINNNPWISEHIF